jgi:hypothetical protein
MSSSVDVCVGDRVGSLNRCVMSLPTWNDTWEKPNPMRGRRGWAGHHYADVAVAAVMVALALGVSLPAVVKVREVESRIRRSDVQREREFTTNSFDSIGQR